MLLNQFGQLMNAAAAGGGMENIQLVGITTGTHRQLSGGAVGLTGLTGGIASSPSENDVIIAITGNHSPVSDPVVYPNISGGTAYRNVLVSGSSFKISAAVSYLVAGPSTTSVSFAAYASEQGNRNIGIAVFRGLDTAAPIAGYTEAQDTANNSPPYVARTPAGTEYHFGGGIGNFFASTTNTSSVSTNMSPNALLNFRDWNGGSHGAIGVRGPVTDASFIDPASLGLHSGMASVSWILSLNPA